MAKTKPRVARVCKDGAELTEPGTVQGYNPALWQSFYMGLTNSFRWQELGYCRQFDAILSRLDNLLCNGLKAWIAGRVSAMTSRAGPCGILLSLLLHYFPRRELLPSHAVLVFYSISFEALIAKCGSKLWYSESYDVQTDVGTLVSLIMNQANLMWQQYHLRHDMMG